MENQGYWTSQSSLKTEEGAPSGAFKHSSDDWQDTEWESGQGITLGSRGIFQLDIQDHLLWRSSLFNLQLAIGRDFSRDTQATRTFSSRVESKPSCFRWWFDCQDKHHCEQHSFASPWTSWCSFERSQVKTAWCNERVHSQRWLNAEHASPGPNLALHWPHLQ